jgi:V8-like Glu-specific endopeptidase
MTDTNKPMTIAERQRLLKPRPALNSDAELTIQYNQLVAGAVSSPATVEPQEVESLTVKYDAQAGQAPNAEQDKSLELGVIVKVKPGVRVFPSSIPATAVALPAALKAELKQKPQKLEGFIPDHLPFHPFPEPLEDELKVRKYYESLPKQRAKGVYQATTIFAPDDRLVYSDTSYPWGTVGRVTTAGGVASGVMVGPRHLLTVSHTVVWNSDGSTGWLNFAPAYFDGSTPFGTANSIQVYFYRKVVGPDLDGDEQREDYVVAVLDQRIGDSSGWMGTRSYTDAWDGGSYWSHAGYPGDIAATQRPTYQGSIALDGSADEDSHERMAHFGDVWPGQSGGPFFAWWDGDSVPYVVAVQSGQSAADNSASGGSYIVNLVSQALREFP